ncbi:MAG TPA: hypothetical protein VGQ57_18870 [Polyangiaceae bacterium]|nr:hypothetical protein [Polyangiaceae bacterium]
MARSGRSRNRRLGRRVGIAIFAVLVAAPTLIWTWQIMRALFYPEPSVTLVGPAPGAGPPSCRAGLLGLLEGIERARDAGRSDSTGERQSLSRFRAALGPAWDHRSKLDALCEGQGEGRDRLREIDALRYAEEHAVRYEATALAHQRQRARELEQTLSRQHE